MRQEMSLQHLSPLLPLFHFPFSLDLVVALQLLLQLTALLFRNFKACDILLLSPYFTSDF